MSESSTIERGLAKKGRHVKSCSWLIIVLLSLAGSRAEAARVLHDFERPEDLAALDIRGDSMQPLKDYISLDGAYASSRENALRIQIPAWEQGMRNALWMHFVLPRGEGEMGRYDRLVIDATNPTEADLPWLTAFQGPGVPVRYHNVLPARSFRRFVIHLRTLTGNASAEGFSRAELVFWRPKNAVDVHVDRILLLEPGEPVPPADPATLAPQREMMAGAYAGVAPRIEALEARTRMVSKIAPGVVPYAEAWIADLREGFVQLQEPILLERKMARLEGILRLSVDAAALPRPAQLDGERSYTLFAVAPASVKVFPRDMPVPAEATDAVRLDLARGEFESAQFVVLPLGGGLNHVKVTVSELASPGGVALPTENIGVSVVGHVLVGQQGHFRGPDHYHGWYPDPILDFMDSCDIPRGDSQAFWLRVKAPRDQAPGSYRGRLAVRVGGTEAWSCPVEVRVRNFTVPVRPAVPTIVTFWPMSLFGDRPNHNMPVYNEEGIATNYAPDHPVNLWKPRKLEWADFLADYGITYTALSGFPDWEPDFEIIRHLKDQDRLGLWNLGLGYLPGVAAGHFGARGRQVLLDRIDKWAYRYDRARQLDLVDEYAFNYVADEVRDGALEAGNELLQLIRAAYPDVPFVAAGKHFMGEEQVLVPALNCYVDAARQEEWDAARATDKKVFWYIAHGAYPDPRHPGTELESHAIEPRLLVGAMSAAHGADGFLYYQSAIWNGGTPITRGPYTDWPAITHVASYGPVSHGGGHFFDPGPDGMPLATIRAESFRDGLEDYAYFRILEQTLAAVEADDTLAPRHKEWITQARHALDVPAALGSVTTYTCDPDLLYAWRRKLADAIEASPVQPVEPKEGDD
jgi:hypothetical protein